MGPFSQLEMIRMLQSHHAQLEDMVFCESMKEWLPISQVPEFSSEKIKQIRESGVRELSDVFFTRRYKRAHYDCDVLVHNHKDVYKGMSLEISAGGAGLLVGDKNFKLGQKLYLHFKASQSVPAFNAVCEVVSFQKTRIGVKFTNITRDVKAAILNYAEPSTA